MQERLITSLEDLPHVHAAGMTNFLPATGATLRFQVQVEGLTGPNDDGSITVGARMIGGGYLRAIQAQLVPEARCPVALPDTPLSAIVNRRFADVHAHGQDLVGRTLRIVGQGAGAPLFTIAGIAGDIAEDGHAAGAFAYVYTCSPVGWWPDPEYVVRTADARALGGDIRRIVREIDADRAVFGLRPLQEVLDASLQRPRFDAAMLSFFAAAAVILAAIGQYSLFMLVVSERAREMALRLAIGAAPRQVIRLVMTGAGQLLLGGIALGIALTVAAERALRGALFGVSPNDPVAIATAAATLLVVSALAAAVPAIRASRVAPSGVLKEE